MTELEEMQNKNEEEETTTTKTLASLKQKSVRETTKEKTERDKETIAVMESAAATVSADSNRSGARSSIVESLRGCGISGIRIDKEDLKRRILIPEYLRLGIRDAINEKDVDVVVERRRRKEEESNKAPEAPMVVFVNSKSGGRHGPVLKERLQELMGQEQAQAGSHNMSAVLIVLLAIYGAPRQPLVVPIARACLVFDTSQVPPAALEGFAEYSHCWIIYVFHLNTDLEKMWKQPSQSKFKAKVRVPRLKGGRMGVFATRSPHRPCPIGLTVAKVEGVQGNMVLLSGVDLVDGTPVLDIKPYLPYCESIPEALKPEWVTEDNNFSVASINFSHEFSSTLGKCWMTAEEKSLYASPDEIQSLIKQVLQWDIRSLSQRNQPHSLLPNPNYSTEDYIPNSEDDREGNVPSPENGQGPLPSPDAVIYHLMVDVLDVSYRIDDDGNVVVGKVTLNPDCQKRTQHQCNYTTWKDVVG